MHADSYSLPTVSKHHTEGRLMTATKIKAGNNGRLDTNSLGHQSFQRALLMRGVEYSTMYIGWLVFAFLTALPICLLAALTLILIFRWVHLVFALVLMLAHLLVMIMLAFIMALFHNKGTFYDF